MKLRRGGMSVWGQEPQPPTPMGSVGAISLLQQGAKAGSHPGVTQTGRLWVGLSTRLGRDHCLTSILGVAQLGQWCCKRSLRDRALGLVWRLISVI